MSVIFSFSIPPLQVTLASSLLFNHLIDSYLKYLCQEYFLHTCSLGYSHFLLVFAQISLSQWSQPYVPPLKLNSPFSLHPQYLACFSLQYVPLSNTLCNLLIIFIIFLPYWKCKCLEDRGFFLLFCYSSLASWRGWSINICGMNS